ncbi:MAG TPA: M28 family peptidase [Phycisphaerales bacterium]|nr:M28 family peptidase [Phycisphaerales bacterium]HMP38359.1 M28 family peptidase [Phycisphaerales bacterium]
MPRLHTRAPHTGRSLPSWATSVATLVGATWLTCAAPPWTRTSGAAPRLDTVGGFGSAGHPPGSPESIVTLLRGVPDADQLRRWHDLLGDEPHVAGTPGDHRVIERLRGAFVAMGLDVEVHRIHPLLARPIDASLEIVESPAPHGPQTGSAVTENPTAHGPSAPRRRGVLALPLTERNLLEDPSTQHPGLSYGWNAYSGSGDVEAAVVYAHHATRADFDLLRELGVSISGRIVLARYGGNFRGDKVRFAEAEGAAGMVIFGDPADVARGEAYPAGGWADETCIQRGSILRLGRPGDPLTPGIEATPDAPRLELDEVALPRIPVQPIGFGAAGAILARMAGAAAPDAWQGGLPLTYRVEGGESLRLRLRVEQAREIMPTANVVATLPGITDEVVIVGCHHDAWGFGAADPLAGTIVLLETARTFAEAARLGWRPRRTIQFAAWGAEEFGIIGSTEWCEAHGARLEERALAYVNLDMAAMGPHFHASAAPTLARIIRESAHAVPQARDAARSVHALWAERTGSAPPDTEPGRGADLPAPREPAVGLIGGGSDHEAFQYHLGIPSIHLGAGGSPGTSYHTNFDTLQWYRQIVGEDYEPALMVTRMTVEIVRSLAEAPIPPIDATAIAPFVREALADCVAAAEERGVALDATPIEAALDRLHAAASATSGDDAAPASALFHLERRFLSGSRWTTLGGPDDAEAGTPPRWSRHHLYGTDPDAGYSTRTLPVLRTAIQRGDRDAALREVAAIAAMLDAAAESLERAPSRQGDPRRGVRGRGRSRRSRGAMEC